MFNQNDPERSQGRFPILIAIMAMAAIGLAVVFMTKASSEETTTDDQSISENSEALRSFSKIEVDGYFNIELVSEKGFFIEVHGSDLDKKAVDYEVSGSTLNIENSSTPGTNIDITVGCDDIQLFRKAGIGSVEIDGTTLAKNARIFNEGVGDITIRGAGNSLFIDNSGSGSIKATSLDAQKVEIIQSGIGKTELRGRSILLIIDNDAIGEVQAEFLRAQNVIVSNSGIGNVYVNASDSLTITNEGIGSVYYKGNAAVVQKNDGLGTITKISK